MRNAQKFATFAFHSTKLTSKRDVLVATRAILRLLISKVLSKGDNYGVPGQNTISAKGCQPRSLTAAADSAQMETCPVAMQFYGGCDVNEFWGFGTCFSLRVKIPPRGLITHL